MIARPILPAMQDHIVVFCDHAPELHTLTREGASSFLEIIDEALLAIRDAQVVLYVPGAGIAFDGLSRAALMWPP